MTRRLAREEALLVGISAGANLVAARTVGTPTGRRRTARRHRHRPVRRRREIPERTILE